MAIDQILALVVVAIGVIALVLAAALRRADQQESEIRRIQDALERLDIEDVKKTPPHDWY